jgi:site-specific DNA recombinase
MIAAIYARKSTDQSGIGDEEKSVTRQIAHAKAYAAKKGWTVAEDYIYSDDGISGAEFVKRPGFLRLMNALKPRPAFQVLIMSEESRLGREQIETAYALKQITDAGVRIFFYLEDRERTLDSAMDKVMLSLTNFAAEMERERARQRTYDAMARKAQALHVTGGRVYGYDNVDVPTPDGKRAYVVRKINPVQGDVVRRIFSLYAGGLGLVKIAKTLNREHIAPPRGDRLGWAPTAIREILRRELYRGIVVWNRSQKAVRGGTKTQRKRSEDQWLRIEAPELRILDEELWRSVEARREKAATAFPRTREGGRLLGRASRLDSHSPYLLTGFTACTVCGGAVGGSTQYHGNGPVGNRTRVTFYLCTMRRKRGPCICSNDVVLRTDAVDVAVLKTIGEVLDSRVIEKSIELAIARLQDGRCQVASQRDRLKAELDDLDARLGRLVQALVNGGPMETVVAQIKVEEEQKRALTAEYEALDTASAPEAFDYATVVRELRERTADVQAVLRRQTAQARQMLRKLLDGKIAVEPVTVEGQRGFRLSGRLNVGRLLRADVLRVIEAARAAENNSPTVVAPTGFEPVFQP